MGLSNDEIRRYARHLSLPEVGVAGQERLRACRVLCIGAGGLGSPVLLYLAAAGVGRLGIVDFDTVDLSNLQRQVIHRTAGIGRPKTDSAAEAVLALDPRIEAERHPVRLTRDTALELIGGYDLVVDGSDNFATRYLVNDACILLRKPWVYGAIYRFEGQASVFAPHLGGPCYRCLFPAPPLPQEAPSCAEGGVLGVLPGIVGCIQATEAIKVALGCGQLLIGRLLRVDALAMRFHEVKVRPDPACPRCGANPTLEGLDDYDRLCGFGGVDAARAPIGAAPEVSALDLQRALADPTRRIRILDVRELREAATWPFAAGLAVPLSTLTARLADLPVDGTYYLVCQTGARSGQGVALLRERGYARAFHVRGGLEAWVNEAGGELG
jgi:adenylyltransferase/sulfurtransferase